MDTTEHDSFEIAPASAYSISNLEDLHKTGIPSQRSAHVGNQYPANMAYLQELGSYGLFLMNDRMSTDGDKNYHPGKRLEEGAGEQIAKDGILVSHAQVTNIPHARKDGRFIPGRKIVDAHTQSLREAFPKAHIATYTEFLQEHRDLVEPILRFLIEDNSLGLFERFVLPDGTVLTTGIRSVPDRNSAIFGVDNMEHGYLIPNEINILLSGIVDAVESNTNRVIHFSGPDMIRYTKDPIIQAKINRLYQDVRKALGDTIKLPEHLLFELVPFAYVRFATTVDRKDQMDELFNALLQLGSTLKADERTVREEGYECIKGTKREAEMSRRKRDAVNRLKAAVRACPEIDHSLKLMNYPTQYDVLRTGGLYIPDLLRYCPIEMIHEMLRLIERYGHGKDRP